MPISLKVTFTKDAQEEIIENNDESKDDTRTSEVMDRELDSIKLLEGGTKITQRRKILSLLELCF